MLLTKFASYFPRNLTRTTHGGSFCSIGLVLHSARSAESEYIECYYNISIKILVCVIEHKTKGKMLLVR